MLGRPRRVVQFLAEEADRPPLGRRAPVVHEAGDVLLEPLVVAIAPGPFVVGPLPDLGALEHEMGDPLGVGGGEEHRERPSLGLAHDGSPLDAGVVEDGADVVHAGLEWGAWGAARREAHAALVVDDEPAELPQRLGEATEERKGPVDVEMADVPEGPDERDVALTRDRVGDVGLVGGRIVDLGHGVRVRRSS